MPPLISIVEASLPPQLDEVRHLLRAFVDWQRARYSAEAHLIDEYFDSAAYGTEIATLPGMYAAPRGHLLLACYQGQPAGCVALRDLGDGVCEMKRMFVYPDYRGKAVGRALGAAIVAAARQMNYDTMRLDTGRRQIEAQTLYHRLGFRNIDPYYAIPDDLRGWLVFMELDLISRGRGMVK